jgi:phosphohistidine phosphatase SixA
VQAAVATLLAALSACGSERAAERDGTVTLVRLEEPAHLLDALREGGYVIYFRHAATDQTQADNDGPDLADCALQRNLSDEGRAQAEAIGAAFRALAVPVGDVRASRYCRARETARIAFGEAVIDDALTGYLAHTSAEEKERRLAALYRLLTARPERGNTILVAHQFNLTDLVDVSLLEGEAAIFQPGDDGSVRLLAIMEPEDWAELK